MKNLLIILCLSQCFVVYPQPMWKRGNYAIGAQAKDAYGDVYAATKNHNSTTPPSGSNTNWKYVRSTSFVSNDTLAARVTKLEAKVSAPVVSTPPVVTAPVDTLKFPANNITPASNCFSVPTFTYTAFSGQTAPGDVNFNLTLTGTAAAGTPIITEYTRIAGSSETIILTGINFTSGTTFTCCSKSATGTATVRSIDVTNQLAVITLPALGSWSTFLLVAENASGKGAPVLINKTEAWWAEDEIVAGQTASVYGRNLATAQGTTTGAVRLKNTSTSVVTNATVVTANPYKIDYTVPAVANGTYEVYVHNGHGANYGWSKSENNVTVWGGLVWSGGNIVPTLTLNSEAAAGANTTALNAAILSAGSMKTVNLSSYTGTIYVNAGLESQWDTRILGAGKTSTIIKTVSSSYHSTDKFFKTATPNNFQLENLTIEITSNYANDENRYIFPFRNNDYLVLKNIKVKGKGVVLADLHLREHLYFTDCDFEGKQIDLLTTRQTFIRNCTFKQTNSTLQSINSWGTRDIDVSGCTVSDLGTDPTDQGKGRFISGNGQYQGSTHWYVANNTGTNLGPSDGDLNMGEWLMFENNLTKFSASPTSSTSTTTTFSGTLPTIYAPETDLLYAYIIRGPGAVQYRLINPATTTDHVLGIYEPWTVQPTTSSIVQIAGSVTRVVAYKNSVTGKAGLATAGASNALSLIVPYGNCIDWTADGNKATGYRLMLSNNPTMHADGKTDPNLWQLYINDTAINCTAGAMVRAVETTYSNPSGPFVIGNVIRNFRVTGAIKHTARYQLPTSAYTYPSILGIVWEYSLIDSPVLMYDDENDVTGSTPTSGTIADAYYNNPMP